MTKTARSTSCWIGAVALVAGLLGAGEARAQGLICPTVPPAIPTFNPISCTVNCAQGGTIASALSLRARSTNNFTITINGTCVESVDQVPSGVTLQAGASGATLQAPSASTFPVLGISGTGVILNNLTVLGGAYTLQGHPGAAFTGNNLVIEGASNADVLLDHAVVTLNNSTIQNSAGDGISAYYGSTVFLNGGVVQKNANWGITAAYDASAGVDFGAIIQNNGTETSGTGGAQATWGGSISVNAGTVQNNVGTFAGLFAAENGSLSLGSSGSVINNAGNGVFFGKWWCCNCKWNGCRQLGQRRERL